MLKGCKKFESLDSIDYGYLHCESEKYSLTDT